MYYLGNGRVREKKIIEAGKRACKFVENQTEQDKKKGEQMYKRMQENNLEKKRNGLSCE